MILGYAIFRMDAKIGPQKVHVSDSIQDVSHYEMMIIFSAHVRFEQGFRGVHASNRTWATYIQPPWVIALLLSPDQLIGPIEAPFEKILRKTKLGDNPTINQWNKLFQDIKNEVEKSPLWDLLTSEPVAEFLETLIKFGISTFEPQLNLSIGVVYPEADRLTNLSSYDTRLFLEKLTLAGIFKSEPVAGVIHCPSCHGFKVANLLTCPKCSGISLKSVPDSSASNSISYNFSCLSCSHLTQNPLVSLVCTECARQFEPSTGEYRAMNRLVLNKEIAENLISSIRGES
ncbi:MAG: hypothetical protein ACFFDP_02545 [Promethearchaeota archaeon]